MKNSILILFNLYNRGSHPKEICPKILEKVQKGVEISANNENVDYFARK